MTIGTGYDGRSDLAALLSASEDRTTSGLLSGSLDPDPASFEVDYGVSGATQAGGSSYNEDIPLNSSISGLAGACEGYGELEEATDDLCSGLGKAAAPLDSVLRKIGRSDRYLAYTDGDPWPSVDHPSAVARGYLDPTVFERKSNINQGWNAAAQPGAAPGLNVGFGEVVFGDLSWKQALNYSPAPLTDNLGALQGLGAVSAGPNGLKFVLEAANNPLTKGNQLIANKLVDQSTRLADTMEKRSKVVVNARRRYQELEKRVGELDKRVNAVANRIYDAEGEVRMDANPKDVRRMAMLRKKGFQLAREAVRYLKTNVLATGLMKNAAYQTDLLQQIATATALGNEGLVKVLAAMFDKLGENSALLRTKRAEQVQKWRGAPTSLSGFDGATRNVVTSSYWESDLAGMEIVERAYLGELEAGLERFGSRFKKFAKKVKKKVKKGVKKVGKVTKKIARAPITITKKITKKVAPRLHAAAIKMRNKARAALKATVGRAKRAALAAAKKVRDAAKRVATAAAKKAAAAAKKAAIKIKNSKVGKNFVKVARPIGKALKGAAKVVVAPVKMTVRAGKAIASGNPRGALRAIKQSLKETGKGIAAVGTSLTTGLSCAMAGTRLGKGVAKGVGKAVGTFYGGTAGGSVGTEIGNKANDFDRSMCAGMEQLGLAGGKSINLKAKNWKKAANATGKQLKKKFSKEEMLKSVMRIAAGMATGGTGSSIANIGTNKIMDVAREKAMDFGRKKALQAGTKLATRGATAAFGGKAGRIIGQAAGAAGSAYGGGGFDTKSLTRAGQQFAKTQGRAAARRYGGKAATRVLGRRAGGLLTQGAQVAAGSYRSGGLNTEQLRKSGIQFAKTQGRSAAQRYGSRAAGRVFGARGGRIASSAGNYAARATRGGGFPAGINRESVSAFARNRLRARAEAAARQQAGVPGALLRARRWG